jgi:hypothetical protein
VQAAVARARSRLAALQADPRRNARQALRVLLKFWLLEVRRATLAQAAAHFRPTRYFTLAAERHFPGCSTRDLVRRAAQELAAAGAARWVEEAAHAPAAVFQDDASDEAVLENLD